MLKKQTLLIGFIFCVIARVALADDASLAQYLQWPMFGQNWANTSSGFTFTIGRHNVGKLKPKWTFTTHGDVSARASVSAISTA